MRQHPLKFAWTAGALGAAVFLVTALVSAQDKTTKTKVAVKQDAFTATMTQMQAAKPAVMQKQAKLLAERYDLSDRPAKSATMTRGKALQEGPRAKLANGIAWQKLAALTPD